MLLIAAATVLVAMSNALGADAQHVRSAWLQRLCDGSSPDASNGDALRLTVLRHDFLTPARNTCVDGNALIVSGKPYSRGIGTHQPNRLRLMSDEPMDRFEALIGINGLDCAYGSAIFVVEADGRQLFRSKVTKAGDPAQVIRLPLSGAKQIDLIADDSGEGSGWGHADWLEPTVLTRSGRRVELESLPFRYAPIPEMPKLPFSFVYGGEASDAILDRCQMSEQTARLGDGRTRRVVAWQDDRTGLKVEWQMITFDDFPAVEWVLFTGNTGTQDTPILSRVRALDVAFTGPFTARAPYLLHHNKGAPSSPDDFMPVVSDLVKGSVLTMRGGAGRSSNEDFPFYKIESAAGSVIVAVGWTGEWKSEIACPDGQNLRLRAGLDRTAYKLHPGERVRGPRMLILHCPEPDTWASNALFRQLLNKYYVARDRGAEPVPALFCNTCFTRYGLWCNECNEQNQISLIHALAPLGVESVITDAGWFRGGWPDGAGNWDPDPKKYPQGMAPVAAAAEAHGMRYGLWFEFERVGRGTAIEREHPQWLLGLKPDSKESSDPWFSKNLLLNLASPEVRAHLIRIVSEFTKLPGFGVYRQDFNIDPLPFWRDNDPPDRVGMTEMLYVQGMYDFWDELRRVAPHAYMNGCSSGGKRIDLESIGRFHSNQQSDLWFDLTVDQCRIWALSQYLPNNAFETAINRVDEYAIRSALPSALIVGWIADSPDFERDKALALTKEYLEVRHLLTAAWYPILPYSRSPADWMASQWHRPDLDEGIVVCVRRPQSPYSAITAQLKGLNASASYEVQFRSAGRIQRRSGRELLDGLPIKLPSPGQTELIHYRSIK